MKLSRGMLLLGAFSVIACGEVGPSGQQHDASDNPDPIDADPSMPDAADPDAMLTPNPVMITVTAAGPGSVAVTPAGTPCGVGCTQYAVTTTVTLTPTPGAALAEVQSWTAPCAATAPGAPCTFSLSANTAVTTTFRCTVDVLVDQVNGTDANAGTCTAPVKRITRAMQIATSGQVVRVMPGLYDTANGEVFPITVSGVSLIGDEATKGQATAIQGVNGNVVEPSGTATVAGFKITGGNGTCVLQNAAGATTVRNNQLTGCGNGLWFNAGGPHLVTDNLISSNGYYGIAHIGIGIDAKYERNHVNNNISGVETDASGADFGGGPLGSAGGNQFYCNSRNDLWIHQTITLFAQNNFFDHSPPTFGSDGNGVDIWQNLSGTIDRAGAGVVAAPCTGGPPTTFGFTGALQSYTVPAGVNSVRIEATGASGGDTGAFLGGVAAFVDTTVAVSSGQVLQVVVGEQPAVIGPGSDGCGASGGGGSFVVRNGTEALAVAGGGGGAAGYASCSINGGAGSLNADGGSSGTFAGGTGGNGGPGYTGAEGGGGGGLLTNGGDGEALGGRSFASGSAGGTRAVTENCAGSNGGYGGGAGGGNDCAGGGGGYSGGAAQNYQTPSVMAGGGGSMGAGGATSISNVGSRGHGSVTITPM